MEPFYNNILYSIPLSLFFALFIWLGLMFCVQVLQFKFKKFRPRFVFTGSFVVSLLILSGLRIVYMEPMVVKDYAMFPTMVPEEVVLVKKAVNLNKIKHGDIVLYRAEDKKLKLHRVIAMGGEKVQIDANGISINQKLQTYRTIATTRVPLTAEQIQGQVQLEHNHGTPYPIFVPHSSENTMQLTNTKIPAGQFLVAGDFRSHAKPWLVHPDQIVGVVEHAWFSLDKLATSAGASPDKVAQRFG